MPTGYTDCISKEASFKEFATHCAYAFGALVAFRDSGVRDELPKKIEASDYHKKRINELKQEQRNLKTTDQGKYNREQHKKDIAYYEGRINEANSLREKYNAMLEKVRAWQPPTPDHDGMKKFMIEQITMSIEGDCDTSYYKEKLNNYILADHYHKRLAEIPKDIQYHTEKQKEEEKRIAERNGWLQALKKSLE